MKAARLLLVAALLGAVLAGLAGCGHPFIPAAAVRVVPTSACGIPALPAPAEPAHPVLGVDLYARTGYSLSTVATDGRADMAYLRDVLGAQSVGLVWNLTSPGNGSDVVAASPDQSLSPAALGELTQLAYQAGMSVQYRPLIRVGPVAGWDFPSRSWEGHIRPADPETWFDSLFRAEWPYLEVAQRLHVPEFVVGTELRGIGDSVWWPCFLKKVQAVYTGAVSYAAVTSQYLGTPGQLPPVAAVGLDAYPGLDLPAAASQQEVTAAWERRFSGAPLPLLRATAMDEVSIPALAGAYHRPDDWNARGRSDLQVQARWFTAACATAARFRMRAVYFYELPLSRDPARRLAFPAFFAGKPGGAAIRGCGGVLRLRRGVPSVRVNPPGWPGMITLGSQ